MKQDLQSVVDDIKSVKVQGAKQIAVHSLKFLKKFCKRHGFGLKFEVAAKILEDARPTAVVLHNCIDEIKKNRSINSIDKLLNQMESSTKKIAKNGSKLIKKGSVIMTHCHSGEALSVIKQARKDGKKVSVIATETDPLEQGVKTAKELARARIPVTLITDNAVGHFMKDADCVVVGTDAIRIVKPLGIVNKTGTINVALAAREFNKPLYVVGSTLKIDKRKKFYIEERPAEEIRKEISTRGKLKGVKIRNPAFDLVDFKLIKSIITEKGVYTPAKIRRLYK